LPQAPVHTVFNGISAYRSTLVRDRAGDQNTPQPPCEHQIWPSLYEIERNAEVALQSVVQCETCSTSTPNLKTG
jgi:hypothetical protein